MYVCKGICRNLGFLRGFYKKGHKRCTECQIFFMPNDVGPNRKCKCCGATTRVRARFNPTKRRNNSSVAPFSFVA